MQQSTLLSLLGSLQSYRETQEQKLKHTQSLHRTTTPSLEPKKRTELWLSLIPENFQNEAREFFTDAKTSNGVTVYDRHKVRVEHDTLFLSHIINKSRVKELPLVTTKKLALMRNMIYLYLNFNPNVDYHNAWTFIAYIVLTLENTEEEDFVFFAYLLQNVLSNFFLCSGNYEKKLEMITNLYLLVEVKRFNFTALLTPLASKTEKTLPNYSQIQRNKKTSFFSLTNFFKTKTHTNSLRGPSIDNIPIPTSPSQKGHIDLPLTSEYINDLALFSLIQSTLEIWFGMLFANILQLKDCLELWDHFFMHGTDFLFQFSLSVINHLDSKLVEVIKREKQKLSSLGIEDNPQASFAIVSSLKTVFMTALTREEFQAVLTAAKEKSLETFVKERSLSCSKKKIQIVINSPFERLQHLAQVRKELNALRPMSKKNVCSFLDKIEELDEDELKIEDLITILEMEGILSPNLALKIFSLVDLDLKGFLEKKELKTFFILFTDGAENKLFLLWKETGNQSQLSISADEGIKLLQMIERFISPNSVEVDEEVAKIYQAWIQMIPGNITPLKTFIQFVLTSDVLKILRTSLEIIDGNISVETKKNLSRQRICGTNEKMDMTNEELDSMDFSILNDSKKSPKEKSLSDDSDSQISLVTSRIENHKDIECKEDVKEIEVPQMDPHTLMTSQRERLLVRSISFSKVKSSVPGSTVTDNYFVCPTSSRNADPC